MSVVLSGDRLFSPYDYEQEEEFERRIVEYSNRIFGEDSRYVDVKKAIGDSVVSIPDGYLLDFAFAKDPRLYIIENELAVHDPYRHIGQQILRFAISYKQTGRRIKKFLLSEIKETEEDFEFVEKRAGRAGFPNVDALLDELIFEKPVAAIVVIDSVAEELENVLSQLTLKTDIIEFETYTDGDRRIHRFSPFQQEIREIEEHGGEELSREDLDTIVVPANEEGFNETFLGEDCWYKIRISSSMIDRIDYIAGYQTAPVSAITHYAEVANIEKYKDTNKYILYFKEPAEEIGPIELPKGEMSLVPRAPRYTSFRRLVKADTLEDVF